MSESDETEIAAPHSYFIPMVDMLAGVVFILVILLASVTLVSRDDFSASETAQKEMARIAAELENARTLDRTVLEPRRKAEADMRLLLARLRDGLARRSITAEIDPAEGSLAIPAEAFFPPAGVTLTPVGKDRAEALAEVLSPEIGCLAVGKDTGLAACGGYAGSKLDRAVLGVEESVDAPGGQGTSRSAARALQVLSAVVAGRPDLVALKAPDGGQLVSYGGLVPAAPTVAAGAATASAAARIVLLFQMDVPPLPSAAPVRLAP